VANLHSAAYVSTERPSRYLKQVCSHFGHKIESQYDETTGRLGFPFGTCELEAQDGTLVLRVAAPDAEQLDRIEGVVGGHLERFGTKDALQVVWHRAE